MKTQTVTVKALLSVLLLATVCLASSGCITPSAKGPSGAVAGPLGR